MLGRLCHDDEASSEIRGDHPIEGFETALGDRPHWHDAGAVHHDVDPAEGAERLLEQALDSRRVGHVPLNGEGVAVGGLDLGHGRFGIFGIAGVVQDDPEAVASQTQGHRPSDTARSTSDKGNLSWRVSHRSVLSPHLWAIPRMRTLFVTLHKMGCADHPVHALLGYVSCVT